MRSARLEQARLETELESLGREVDPHFLFNNLNALAHLVDQRSDAAPCVHPHAERDLPLRARMPRPRAGSARRRARGARTAPGAGRHPLCRRRAARRRRPARRTRTQLLLPPVSLAELFQNALKHNTAGPDDPLHIRVRVDDATLVFENDLRPDRGGAFDRDRSRQSAGTIPHRDRACGRMGRRGGSIRRAAAARPEWARVLVAVTAACLQ